MAKTLYICYFGVRQPLVQTQVLPYLRELMKDGAGDDDPAVVDSVSLLTFEPTNNSEDREEFVKIREALAEEGITWYSLPYHKRLSILATAWDILRGTLLIRKLIRRQNPDVLHGRVHVPVLMGALARRTSRKKPKLLFDIRGFFPEEYVDAGVWKQKSLVFRIAKRVENWLLKESDGFVVLTEKARSLLFPSSELSGVDAAGKPVEVIPCCVDLQKFSGVASNGLHGSLAAFDLSARTVVLYVGSFGGWYLTDETIRFFSEARRTDSSVFALILTQSEKEPIMSMLKGSGFGESDFLVTEVKAPDVPAYLAVADVAVSFIKPCYSKQASSPTKNAEYLSMGIPVVANTGIGDTDALISGEGIGIIVEDLGPESLRNAFNSALELRDSVPDLVDRCKRAARKHFDLSLVGGVRYRRIYRSLLNY